LSPASPERTIELVLVSPGSPATLREGDELLDAQLRDDGMASLLVLRAETPGPVMGARGPTNIAGASTT
jgi:hypothetical protein